MSILFKAIVFVVGAVIYILSDKSFFQDVFGRHKSLVVTAGIVTIVGGIFLIKDMYGYLDRKFVKPPIPPVVQPPVVQPPVVQPPVIQPPVIQPPVVQSPVIQSPVIQPPVIQPPVIQPPVVQPPPGVKHQPDFSKYFKPKKEWIEKDTEFLDRRNQLVEDFNNQVKGRNLAFQVGTVHLDKKKYDANSEIFSVTVKWKSTWMSQFFSNFQTKRTGSVKVNPQTAKQMYESGADKPLFVLVEMSGEKVKIQKAVMVEGGQVFDVVNFIENQDLKGRAMNESLASEPFELEKSFEPVDAVELKSALESVSSEISKNRAKKYGVGKVFQDTLQDGSLAPKMVVVPAGSFEMGDNNSEYKGESPVHTVSVNQFAIGVYEITFEEYDKFCDSTGRSKPDDAGWGRGTRPVIHVSWNDAVAYTKWLSEQTGNDYRLPTEAEWEYAARAGSRTKYWWGDDSGSNRANCDGCGSQWDNKSTAPVGSFSANGFGLYDTAGNVWEWTCSDYTREGYGSGAEQVCSENTNENKAVRGGSWGNGSINSRSALRNADSRVNTYDIYGFRILRTY